MYYAWFAYFLSGDNAWPELASQLDRVIHVTSDWSVAALPHGMDSGQPSVMLRLDLPDGRVVLAETSMALFLGAAFMFRGRFGDDIER